MAQHPHDPEARKQAISDIAVVLFTHTGQADATAVTKATEFVDLLAKKGLPLPTGAPFITKPRP